MVKSHPDLTDAQRDALLYIAYRGAPELRELRANGFNRRVIQNLCGMGLTYWAGWFADDSDWRAKTTDDGTRIANRHSEWQEDPRRWWVITSDRTVTPQFYPGKSGRAAVAAFRLDLVTAERTNGRTRSDAEMIVSTGRYSAEGPLATSEASSLEFGWALAEAISARCHGQRVAPEAPATIADATRHHLPGETIERLRQQVTARYEPAARPVKDVTAAAGTSGTGSGR